jgi:hypothetical protein
MCVSGGEEVYVMKPQKTIKLIIEIKQQKKKRIKRKPVHCKLSPEDAIGFMGG